LSVPAYLKPLAPCLIWIFLYETLSFCVQESAFESSVEKDFAASDPAVKILNHLLHVQGFEKYLVEISCDDFEVETGFDSSVVLMMANDGNYVLPCQSLACPPAVPFLYSFLVPPPLNLFWVIENAFVCARGSALEKCRRVAPQPSGSLDFDL